MVPSPPHRYLFMGLLIGALTGWTVEGSGWGLPEGLLRGVDVLGICGALAIWYYYEYASQSPAHVRGAELEDLRNPTTPPAGHAVSANVRAMAARWSSGPGATGSRSPTEREITIGTVAIPRSVEPQGFLLTGAPGTGKSVTVAGILDVVRARGNERAIVYDPTGEFLTWFAQPGDVILNPLDKRSEYWVPWRDAHTSTEYERLAEALVPENPHQPFWHTSARALLSACLAETHDMRGLLALMGADNTTLSEVLRRHGMAGLEGDDRTLANVRSAMVAPTISLRYLSDPPDGRAPFSIREWAQRGSGWLWLTSTVPTHDTTLRPLLSLWIDIATVAVMELPPDRERRVWLVLDELRRLQQLPALQSALAGGRKYGLSAVLGIQTIAQLSAVYGQDEARAILGMPQTQLILRTPDPDTAGWASRAIGERHVVREVYGTSRSPLGPGESITYQHDREPTVLASEIQGLKDLEGYLRVANDPTIKQVRLEPQDRTKKVKSYVPAPSPSAATSGPAASSQPPKPETTPEPRQETETPAPAPTRPSERYRHPELDVR